jgi:hypothetical protein
MVKRCRESRALGACLTWARSERWITSIGSFGSPASVLYVPDLANVASVLTQSLGTRF